MDWAYQEIRAIQEVASQIQFSNPVGLLSFLVHLKGWAGIKEIDGRRIEGSYRSHQVPAKDAKDNPNV